MSEPKRTIQEVIVVEGRHDTATLKRYYNCDTIETGGTSLSKETLDWIKACQQSRGVIIFTDPDSPGNRIRHQINQAVPGCLNAFVQKRLAKTEKKVGVEHAEKQALDEALDHLIHFKTNPKPQIQIQQLYELGIAGGKDSGFLRAQLESRYHIGAGTAKTICQRLNCLGITYEQLEKDIKRGRTQDDCRALTHQRNFGTI